MHKFEYILFDVAGTLLHKPSFFDTLLYILNKKGFNVSMQDLLFKHKLLSETIKFPDRTNRKFYNFFNKELLYSLGLLPDNDMLNQIYTSCSYLPWEKHDDTDVLEKLEMPTGVISNFNSSLRDKLGMFFDTSFSDIIVSEEIGISKPEIAFYKKALEIINVSPDKILYIGDSVKLDLQPGLSSGIDTLIIDRINFYPGLKNKIVNLNQILQYI